MTTGEKLIRATQWQPLDGSASNATPRQLVQAGSQTQKIQVPVLSFDGSGTTVQYACYTTRVPIDYASGGTLKLLWMTVGTSGNVKWQAQVGAVTPADADTMLEHAWSTAATVTTNANTTEARRVTESSITLNMDSAAAGDVLSLLLSRDPANDTNTQDAELISATFQYTAVDVSTRAAAFTMSLAGGDLTSSSYVDWGMSNTIVVPSGASHVYAVHTVTGGVITANSAFSMKSVLNGVDGNAATGVLGIASGSATFAIYSSWTAPAAGSYTLKTQAKRDSATGGLRSTASHGVADYWFD